MINKPKFAVGIFILPAVVKGDKIISGFGGHIALPVDGRYRNNLEFPVRRSRKYRFAVGISVICVIVPKIFLSGFGSHIDFRLNQIQDGGLRPF